MRYMQLNSGFPTLSKSAVTLGKFDGIHRGHQKLIRKILEQKKNGYETVVCAFVSAEETLQSSEERMHFLEKLGVDLLLECPLDEHIRHMQAELFVREILLGNLNAGYIAVGEDFRFGYKRQGTPELLQRMGEKLGFQAEVLADEMEGDRKVSSTFIREELMKGDMPHVASLLARPFTVEGTVLHGRGMGHKDFFPTANLIPPRGKLMPPNGVYATISRFGEKTWKGITDVGYKPTVGGENFLGVETYLFDCDEDLYGQPCTVEFYSFLRPEKKFDSFTALKEQIEKDVLTAGNFFTVNEAFLSSPIYNA